MNTIPVRHAATALLAVACSGAGAQAPSVTVYGLLDVAVEHLTKVAPSGGGLTRVPSLTGAVPSRLGFRGSEALGGGTSANFALEMGIATDTGGLGQGGRAFGRQAWVGLSGPWGSAALGRQYTMLFWSLLESDVMGPSIHGAANFDPYLPNARADNAVSYRGSFAGVTVGATYSLGRDVANAGPGPAGTNCPGESATAPEACREWSLLAKYDAPRWGLAFAVDELRGGPGAFGGLTAAMKDRRATVNGYWRVGGSRFGAGLLRRDNGASALTPRSDLWYLSLSHPVTPAFTADAQWFRYDLKHSAADARLWVLRGTYAFSKRSAVYASLSRMDNRGAATFSASGGQPGGNPAPGAAQTGLGVGIRHAF